MKTKLGLYLKYRQFISYLNSIRYSLVKVIIGVDYANILLQNMDRFSVIRILKTNGAQIGLNCKIESGIVFHNCKNFSNLLVGNNSFIGKNCFFDLRDRIIIDENVVVSMKCTFITHIDLAKSCLSEFVASSSEPIHIGKNSYLGANCTILKGVRIDQNCIVGASSLVNKNIEKGSIVGGIPARQLKNKR